MPRPDHTKDIASVRRQAAEGGLTFEAYLPPGLAEGSALHVMLFLENILKALFIFNGLRSRHCQRALLGYHYP